MHHARPIPQREPDTSIRVMLPENPTTWTALERSLSQDGSPSTGRWTRSRTSTEVLGFSENMTRIDASSHCICLRLGTPHDSPWRPFRASESATLGGRGHFLMKFPYMPPSGDLVQNSFQMKWTPICPFCYLAPNTPLRDDVGHQGCAY